MLTALRPCSTVPCRCIMPGRGPGISEELRGRRSTFPCGVTTHAHTHTISPLPRTPSLSRESHALSPQSSSAPHDTSSVMSSVREKHTCDSWSKASVHTLPSGMRCRDCERGQISRACRRFLRSRDSAGVRDALSLVPLFSRYDPSGLPNVSIARMRMHSTSLIDRPLMSATQCDTPR